MLGPGCSGIFLFSRVVAWFCHGSRCIHVSLSACWAAGASKWTLLKGIDYEPI